jgi:hypothetical protein
MVASAHFKAAKQTIRKCQNKQETISLRYRVTRLGEFSPIGFFTLGSVLKIKEIAQIFWLLFSTMTVM